jgi:predicted aspartyl protease
MTTFGQRHTDDTRPRTTARSSGWLNGETPTYIWAPGLAVVAFVLFVIIRPHLSTATSVVADKPATPAATAVATARVPLKKIGGTYVVPVEINGSIMLDFTVDSGAADVTVPLDVFYTLTRTGTIKDTDIIGKQTYVLANGSKMQSATFTLRSLKVGDLPTIFRVKGGVAPLQGSLLLGQSFLERFKSWSMDNTKHVLLLEPR